jgi:tetratricopeptide (TPR) repeat protein
VPGHIFLLVSTDVHERNRFALGMEESRFVIADDEVWIPLETTALSKGFAEAWRIGAESHASWASRGRVDLVDVGDAQTRYEPGTLSGTAIAPSPDPRSLQSALMEDLGAVAGQRQAYLAARYGGARSGLQESPEAMNEIAHVYLAAGRLDDAKAALERALAREPESARTRNNLGAVWVAVGELERASEQFRAAIAVEGDDAGYWLNLGLARYAAGDSRPSVDRRACAPDSLIRSGGAHRMTAGRQELPGRDTCRRLPPPKDQAAGGRAGYSTRTDRR